jgi:hypothetical protein
MVSAVARHDFASLTSEEPMAKAWVFMLKAIELALT